MPKAEKAGTERRRTLKDDNAPKKPMSAYLIYTNQCRQEIKTNFPDLTFGEVGKKMGEMWRALDESEKAKYQNQAEKDRHRYEEQQKVYLEGDQHKDFMRRKHLLEKARGQRKKDPSLPKKPKSAFMYFSTSIRPSIVQDHPELDFAGIGKKIGEMWRELPDAQRAKYEEESQKDKERYQNELQNGVGDGDDDEE